MHAGCMGHILSTWLWSSVLFFCDKFCDFHYIWPHCGLPVWTRVSYYSTQQSCTMRTCVGIVAQPYPASMHSVIPHDDGIAMEVGRCKATLD